MMVFNVETAGGPLGGVTIAEGNTEKYFMRFEDVLDAGVLLASGTVATDADDATVSVFTRSDDRRHGWFFVTAPTADEVFTVTVTVTTTDGQTLVYEIGYICHA